MDSRKFYFIEVNPRIQVEHTVTEVVTGIDLVRSQILITQGHKLHEPPLSIPPQEKIETRGAAIQCRITTEDPENQFIPDYGRLATYRSPGGFAIRLDGGSAFSGAVITPYFDSLLVKVTAWGSTLEEAARRMERALREFRVRGLKTNIPFLENLVLHPAFLSGKATTTFIDTTQELFKLKMRQRPGDQAALVPGRRDRQRPAGREEEDGPVARDAACGRAGATPARHPPPGLRDKLTELGPEKFAAWVRKQKRLLFTDTTMRDAHQSLLATRVRTLRPAGGRRAVAHLAPDLFSLEMWGGATFDTSYAFPSGGSVGAARAAPRRESRTSRSRCCCGRATPWDTRTIPTTWSRRSSGAAPPRASTSSASSTRSTGSRT